MDLDVAFPPLALQVTMGPLTLRPITDAVIPPLIDLAKEGIHDPSSTPFIFPWTDAPIHLLPSQMAQDLWAARARWTQQSWTLEFAIEVDGVVMGAQGIGTHDYLTTRTGETGSWLGRRFQGKGIGTMARRAICTLMFDHLDATEIYSGCFLDNAASLAVSRKLGFKPNGVTRLQRRGGVAEYQRLVLRKQDLERVSTSSVSGLSSFRRFVGLAVEG